VCQPFTLAFPAHGKVAEKKKSPCVVSKSSRKHVRHVLIVDDEPEILNMIETFLADEDFKCHFAHSAEEAWSSLGSLDVDCILLDVNLPGQSGIEMLETLREEHPNIAIVMITACEDPSTAMEAVGAGAYGYLTKPFTKRELIITILHVLDSGGRELQNQD
jgi:DNA-binding response OmpR family regulator